MARIAFITPVYPEEAEERKRFLEGRGHVVEYYGHPDDFFDKLNEAGPPDLILTAFRFKGLPDGEHVRRIFKTCELDGVPIVLYSTSLCDYFYYGPGVASNWEDFEHNLWSERLRFLHMAPYGRDDNGEGFKTKIVPAAEKFFRFTGL